MNLARQHPDVYARYLEELRAHFRVEFLVLSGRTMVHTHEGVAAIDEAIRFDFAGGYVESRPASRSLLARN